MLNLIHTATSICANHSTYTVGCTIDHIPRCFRAMFLVTCNEIRLAENMKLKYSNREFVLTDSRTNEKCTIERFMFIDCRLTFLEFCPTPAIWPAPNKTYITWLWHSGIRECGRRFPLLCRTHEHVDVSDDPRDALTEYMKAPVCREIVEREPDLSTTLTTNYTFNSILLLWRMTNARNWRRRIQARLKKITRRRYKSYF